MTRRGFLLTATAAAQPAPRRKILVILVDGFDPAYFEKSDMPNLRRMAREGGMKIGQNVVPTVTNVNNASVVTRCFPSEHGIVSNYFYDRATGKSEFMETPEYLLKPTLFEIAHQHGLKTALVSAKDKVRTLLQRGADQAISVEHSGSANIYSAGGNYAAFSAASRLLKDHDLVYLSTTDYMMHTYPPEDARSLEHCHTLDKMLGEIADAHPRLEVSLTADHGMNAKTEAIDLARLLAAKSVECEAVPIIRDKHVVHHQNLGGACYIFLRDPKDEAKATAVLRETPGVESVLDRASAAGAYHLLASRIGDLFVLGDKKTVFGSLPTLRDSVAIRSHGSLHERQVPLLWYGRKLDPGTLRYNFDLTRSIAF